MITELGIACMTSAIFFDLASYWKQITKTLRTKRSAHISSSAYMMKLAHYTCSVIALAVFSNWVGFTMETFPFVACLICFYLVVKYKPKDWKFWR